MTEILSEESQAIVKRLNRDLRTAAATLSAQEARYLVDAYYTVQEHRIAFANQKRSLDEAGEPAWLIDWLVEQATVLENQIKAALDKYTAAQPAAKWIRAQKGVGPVICAGLLAHIDIENVTSYGQIWSFAGLNPEATWEKGQKRPWNAKLKTLCAFKLGESFVKVCNKEDAFYGQLYKRKKEELTEQNERGEFEATAADILQRKKLGKSTEAYKAYSNGKLPKAHVHARARRFAVKIFLSHLFEVLYELHHKKPAPVPWPIAHGGHVDVLERPGPVI